MDLGLKNAKALITGASKGLGYASAMQLAAEGCLVAINSRSEEKLEKAAGTIRQKTKTQTVAIAGDVSLPGEAEKVVSTAAEKLGGLDLLITNTGGPPPGKFTNFDDEAWEKAINLVFFAHVRLIRAALPFLKKSDRASVLTITSISVKQPVDNLILSNSARGATIGLTKSLSLELGSEGIRFNSILPTYMETDRVVNLLSARAEKNGTSLEEEMKAQSAESPLGRMGRPEEFASAAAFLLSPAASYITGHMLSLDGGMYKGIF